jgi:hypothetical protein
MPRCGLPVRQDGTSVEKAFIFRRLTLRSAMWDSAATFFASHFRQLHNPI